MPQGLDSVGYVISSWAREFSGLNPVFSCCKQLTNGIENEKETFL